VPEDLTCPICLQLFDDPVCWPNPQCNGSHHFCRPCIERMATTPLRRLCPICRAPSALPILDQLWTLPVSEELSARLEADYPAAFAASVARRTAAQVAHEALPRFELPLIPNLETTISSDAASKLSRGRVVDVNFFTAEHFLALAAALANKHARSRFALLMEGQRWGYIAGVSSPQLFLPGKFPATMREAVAHLRMKRKCGKGVMLKMKVVLVDTFHLEGTPREELVDAETAAYLGMGLGGQGVPLRMATLVASPLGDVQPFEVLRRHAR